jgi:uncharacterized membrane protein
MLLASAIAAIGPTRAEPPSFRPFGELPLGRFNFRPTGICADSSVIVGNGNSNGQHRALRWTAASGYQVLLEREASVAGISADATVTAGHEDGYRGPPFVLSATDGYIPLGELAGGSDGTIVADLSSDGTTVVGFGYGANGLELCRWRASTGLVGLGLVNEAFGDILVGAKLSTSSDGEVIVGNWRHNQPTVYEAFRWTASTGPVGLGGDPTGDPQGRFYSIARAISDDGNVIVGWLGGANSGRAARWASDIGWVELGQPTNRILKSGAFAVSADGAVIVGQAYTADAGSGGFVWTERDGMLYLQELLTDGYGLDLSGWSRLVPYVVSADGRFIAGNGTQQPDHVYEGWLARISDVACIGDFDQDRRRGLSDLAILLANFATPQGATHADGDTDDDGDVDLQDLAFLLSNFGRRCPGT